MNKHNKWSENTTYQKVILDMPFAVLKCAKNYKTTFLHFLAANTFINKELEIIFANIRV